MTKVSIVGIVAEIKRSRENDYTCRRCCLFGISEEEYNALKEQRIEVRPQRFHPGAERYLLHCNAWSAMRALGRFGYHFPVMPILGLVEGATGERRVCIWTMVSERKDLPART